MSVQNQANYVNFHKTDVVITTPVQFELLNSYGRLKYINPKYLVVDEVDCLLDANVNQMKALSQLLNQFDFQKGLDRTGRKVR